MCGTKDLSTRFSGSPAWSAVGASVSDFAKLGPKTEPANVPDGEPLPDGEAERDPGGVSVEAKRKAAEGFGRRYARVASDCDRGCASTCWRFLGDLMAEAASGSDWIESAGKSLSGDCMRVSMRARGLVGERCYFELQSAARFPSEQAGRSTR